MCSFIDGQVVQFAEHPVNLTDNTANVQDISRQISREAFEGVPIKLLTAKNLCIPDVDGTRGNNITPMHACSRTLYKNLSLAEHSYNWLWCCY